MKWRLIGIISLNTNKQSSASWRDQNKRMSNVILRYGRDHVHALYTGLYKSPSDKASTVSLYCTNCTLKVRVYQLLTSGRRDSTYYYKVVRQACSGQYSKERVARNITDEQEQR